MKLIGGLIRLTLRLAFLPVRVALATLRIGVRAGWGLGTAPVRVAVGTTRRAGVRGLFCFAAGVGVGLLAAPTSGARLRERIKGLVGGDATLPDPELRDRVAFELAHAPATWHLPQPEVTVLNGEVTLRGSVPHEDGRGALERTAATMPGVGRVHNEVRVDAGRVEGAGAGGDGSDGGRGASSGSAGSDAGDAGA